MDGRQVAFIDVMKANVLGLKQCNDIKGRPL